MASMNQIVSRRIEIDPLPYLIELGDSDCLEDDFAGLQEHFERDFLA